MIGDSGRDGGSADVLGQERVDCEHAVVGSHSEGHSSPVVGISWPASDVMHT